MVDERRRSVCKGSARANRITGQVPACSRVAPGTPNAFRSVTVLDPKQTKWQSEVGDLLTQAASLCVEHGLDVDTFLTGAWSAYVEARPGLQHPRCWVDGAVAVFRKEEEA